MKTKEITRVSLFAALIVVGTFTKIPLPNLPITLQFLFTTLAGSLLGMRLGGMSVGLYIAMGLVGFPVFAAGGGIGYVLMPSFGYLIGMFFGSMLTGYLSHKVEEPTVRQLLLAHFSGLFVVHLCGMCYYFLMKNFYLGEAFGLDSLIKYLLLPFIPGDSFSCIVAAFVTKRLWNTFRSEGENSPKTGKNSKEIAPEKESI